MSGILDNGNWFNYISIAIGIAGLCFAVYERHSRQKLKRVLKNQYMVLFNRIKNYVPRASVIESYIIENKLPTDSKLVRHLWIKYQGLNDLYVSTVGYFLQHENKFTYSDLKKFVDNQFISSEWSEKVWRSLICHRKENRKSEVPDLFCAPNTKK